MTDETAPVRARVTMTFELRSPSPLSGTDSELAAWVADRLARVTDNGPYDFRIGTGRWQEIDFGRIVWEDDAVDR